jgi:hypothetical protein
MPPPPTRVFEQLVEANMLIYVMYSMTYGMAAPRHDMHVKPDPIFRQPAPALNRMGCVSVPPCVQIGPWN